jgi:hypothetical protein
MSLSERNSDNLTNAVVGGLLCSFGTTIFILVHNHRLNMSDILWALASFRPSIRRIIKNGLLNTSPSLQEYSSQQVCSLMPYSMDILIPFNLTDPLTRYYQGLLCMALLLVDLRLDWGQKLLEET